LVIHVFLHTGRDVAAFVTRCWEFPAERVFDAGRLKDLFAAWAADSNIVRAKGVFRIGRDWRLLNLVDGQVGMQPISYRRDSRVELIVRAASNLDWRAAEAGLLAAMRLGALGAGELKHS